jgi:hypothetical protein
VCSVHIAPVAAAGRLADHPRSSTVVWLLRFLLAPWVEYHYQGGAGQALCTVDELEWLAAWSRGR